MTIQLALGGACAAGLLAYLIYALLYAERF